MTNIDQEIFSKYFIPSKSEEKRKILFDNGASISIKYKSKIKYVVKYLPDNYVDYFSPLFIFILSIELKMKIIPIPNIYPFISISIALLIVNYFEKIDLENIWTIIFLLVLFVIILQGILIIPSLWNIRKRVNEKLKS